MEEKKKKSSSKKSSAKSKTTDKENTSSVDTKEVVEETVEEVTTDTTIETEVVEESKETEPVENKPVKGKKGTRRGGGNNKALELEIEKQKELTEEANDKYKRLLAEFENARNRSEKESKRNYDIGAKEVLEKLLPVVDNFERAMMAVPEEDKDRAFEKGIDMIYKQMLTTFEEIGVKPMDAVGQEFNPDLHNAVMHVEDEEAGENVVVEELQKGYMYKEEVLRYSMVKVAN